MSVSKCAKCHTSARKLMGCSKCQLALYCSPECQLADWPKHRMTCSISTGSGELKNVREFEPIPGNSTKDKNQKVIDDLNYIFHELAIDSRAAAVASLVREIKEQRSICNSEGNLLGKSQAYLALVLVYLKDNRFTDSKSAMKRCVETVHAMDLQIAAGLVSVDADIITELKAAIEWNHNVIDSALLKSENDSNYEQIQLMPHGLSRNGSTNSLIKELFTEQNLFLKQQNYDQCIIIDFRCVELATTVSVHADDDQAKSRAIKIVKNRIKHAGDLIDKHEHLIQHAVKESYELLRNTVTSDTHFAMGAK